MPDTPTGRREAGWVFLLALASILTGLILDTAFGWVFPLRPEVIGDWLRSLGVWAPLAYIALMVVAVVVSPVPSVPLDVAAGLAFGWFWGVVYTLVGAELGALIAFGLARRLGRPWLARRLSRPAMARIDELTARRGVKAILLMRLLPVFNFDWVSYGAGLTPIGVVPFALATFVGMIPPVIAIVAVGAAIPTNPTFAGVIFAVLVLAVLLPLIAPWLPRPRWLTPRKSR